MCGGGYAPGPNDWLAQRPIKGHSPKNKKGISTAGHSHRRTSGGKAEAAATKDF